MNYRSVCQLIGNRSFAVLLLLASLTSMPLAKAGVAFDVPVKKGATEHKWTLTSKAFKEGQTVPKLHTADGKDDSPALAWTAPPQATKSLALICDDPDAPVGTWVHWVIFNIPAGDKELAEAYARDKTAKNGAKQGTNSFDKIGYNGPSPPPGKPHRYFFKIYALDSKIDIAPGAKKADLLSAMKDHVLAETSLMGTYGR